MKGRPCKYGERINGKCPPKPYISVFASPPASDSEDDVQVKVFMYEDGEERMFDEFSGQEMASITDYLTSMLKIDESDIYYEGDEDEEMFIGGLDMQGDRIGNGEKKYPLRQKIPVELKQYGLNMEHESEQTIEHAFNGKTIVLTGKMNLFSRDQATEIIERCGGKVASSVSAKTDFVVFGEDAGSKLKKANELGVKVIDEEAFKVMIDGLY